MHIWHPSFRRAEPHGSSQKNFIFLTEDDPPLAGGLTAYRFFWQTLTGMSPQAHSSRKNAILQQKKPPGSAYPEGFFPRVRFTHTLLKSRSAPQRRDFIALRGHAPRRAKRRGIFPSHEPSFAYAQLARQELLGSLQNSHFAPQNRASCGLPLSHPYHRTGPEKTPLKTPVSERSERIGVFPVLPGHGPRSAPQRRDFIAPRGHAPWRGSCRGDKKGCHLRVTAFFYVCRRWSLENTPPAIAQEEGRIQVFSGKERYYPSGNSRWGWTAM